MKLQFELRKSYGHERYYPVNETACLLMQSLIERACLSVEGLAVLAACGAEVHVLTDDGVVNKFNGVNKTTAINKSPSLAKIKKISNSNVAGGKKSARA